MATSMRIAPGYPRWRSAASPDAGDQAIYTLMDILDTKLDSRLVVLSACETSRGRLLPGEGVLGPAQAFLQSGAASVLASHWRVSDKETAAFMQRFYRNLLEQHLPAAAALRRAQLEQLAAGPTFTGPRSACTDGRTFPLSSRATQGLR